MNLGIGGQGSQKLLGINGALIIDFPEYLTFRYGLRATKDSREDVGYVLGLGYNYAFTALPYQSPAFMGGIEVGKISLRLSCNLLKYTYYYYYTSEGDKPAATIRAFGLELGYSFKR